MWKEVKNTTGADRVVLKKWGEKGCVELKMEVGALGQPSPRLRPVNQAPLQPPIIGALPDLTSRQTVAHKAIKSDPRPTLLFGITGSGKTEI